MSLVGLAAWNLRVATERGCSPMSHAIPMATFHVLKHGRCNCNVYGLSRKVTEGNYVQLWGGSSQGESCGGARLGLARPCLVNAGAPAAPQAMGSGVRGSALALVTDGVLHLIGKLQPLLIGLNLPDEVESCR